MRYPAAMQGVLTGQEVVYEELFREQKSVSYCFVNVFLFGLLHAVFVLFLAGYVGDGPESRAGLSVQTQAAVLASGIMVAFFMHAGAGLFFWVFARGLGGRPAFLPLYLNLGIGFIALWPLAPVLAAFQAGIGGLILLVLLGMLALYATAVVFAALKSASGLSALRMSAAMVLTVAYVACFLYLWV
ncbi:MAG: hypothetical protein R6V55_03290 [Desulfovermiculus sp.]